MGPEQEKALCQVQTAVQATLPLGPFNPEDAMVFEGSVADKDVIWQAPIGELQHMILSKSPPAPQINSFLWRNHTFLGKRLMSFVVRRIVLSCKLDL